MSASHPTSEPWWRAWQPVTVALILSACVLTVLLRLQIIPLPWNLTPIGALALFVGARWRSWQAYVLPAALALFTNYLLTVPFGYPFWFFELPFVLGCYALNTWLGRRLAHSENPGVIAGVTVGSSVLFFLVTNFASWLGDVAFQAMPERLYEASLAGLGTCYVMGLPFYRGTFAGDLLFAAALFGAHAVLTRVFFPAERVPTATAAVTPEAS